jgi:hypothetical protein
VALTRSVTHVKISLTRFSLLGFGGMVTRTSRGIADSILLERVRSFPKVGLSGGTKWQFRTIRSAAVKNVERMKRSKGREQGYTSQPVSKSEGPSTSQCPNLTSRPWF